MNRVHWFLESRLPIVLCVCVDLRLSSLYTVGRILFSFDIQGFMRHRSMPDECEHYSSKIDALHMAPKHEMTIFSKTAMKILMKFQSFTEIVSLNKSA
jgi:hypothetical protein